MESVYPRAMSNELSTIPQAPPGGIVAQQSRDERRDPSELGFPVMLPMELALKIDTPANICAHYGISKDQFRAIIAHPVFIKQYQEAIEGLKVDGYAFKMKAKMQAEHMLATSFAMATNPATSDAVRADIIKNTVRWAGYDAKAVDVGQQSSFNIQINLG